jgi:hypothetical protein
VAFRSTQNVIRIHNSRGQVVAGVRADGTLQKDVSASRHFLRQPCRAIAFDVAALDEAERAGAIRIEVKDTDTNKFYRCTFADFRAKAFKVDRGYGPQLAMALADWNKPDPGADQLTLWGRN